MSTPKLTEVFQIVENVDEEDQVDVKAKNVHIDLEPHEHEDVYECGMDEALPPKPNPQQVKAAQKKADDASKRRMKKATDAGYKKPQQMKLPGMPDVFSSKPAPKPGQWPEVVDDRMPLDQAKGKYLHVGQSSGVTPYWLQQTGHTYQSIPSDLMKGLKVDTNPGASWGSGTYKIGDDGSLEMAQSDYDSSG